MEEKKKGLSDMQGSLFLYPVSLSQWDVFLLSQRNHEEGTDTVDLRLTESYLVKTERRVFDTKCHETEALLLTESK